MEKNSDLRNVSSISSGFFVCNFFVKLEKNFPYFQIQSCITQVLKNNEKIVLRDSMMKTNPGYLFFRNPTLPQIGEHQFKTNINLRQISLRKIFLRQIYLS